jgi:hypothetical protein
LEKLRRAQPPSEVRADEIAKIAWYRQRNAELHRRGAAFLEQHSTSPWRWDVLVLLRYGGETRERVSRSGFRQLVPVPESAAAWEAAYFPKLEVLLEAPDASSGARLEAIRQLIDRASRRARMSREEARATVPQVRHWFELHRREVQPNHFPTGIYQDFASLLDAADPRWLLDFLAELETRHTGAGFPDSRIREFVQARRRLLEAEARPLDELWARLKALDPAVGDVSRYRGRVVLLALGPVTYDTFIEQIEDLHAKHAAEGLVILQVASFNRAYGLPSEPEQRRDLEKIVALRRWPWPVLWNPRGHDDIAGRWGSTTFPSWMLIGRDGLLVPARAGPFSISIPRELAQPAPAAP